MQAVNASFTYDQDERNSTYDFPLRWLPCPILSLPARHQGQTAHFEEAPRQSLQCKLPMLDSREQVAFGPDNAMNGRAGSASNSAYWESLRRVLLLTLVAFSQILPSIPR